MTWETIYTWVYIFWIVKNSLQATIMKTWEKVAVGTIGKQGKATIRSLTPPEKVLRILPTTHRLLYSPIRVHHYHDHTWVYPLPPPPRKEKEKGMPIFPWILVPLALIFPSVTPSWHATFSDRKAIPAVGLRKVPLRITQKKYHRSVLKA